MEMETQQTAGEPAGALAEGIAHLSAVAAQLERTAAALEARLAAAPGGDVARVVATVESEPLLRLAELEGKLQAAELKIAELRAQSGGTVSSGRKTIPAAAAYLLAKHGLDTLEQVNGGALDAALTGLSLEQRIAVKSQMLRAGLLG
jgi:hypothetical protein